MQFVDESRPIQSTEYSWLKDLDQAGIEYNQPLNLGQEDNPYSLLMDYNQASTQWSW